MRAVVVTGLGCVSPVGSDVDSTWSALLAGQSGVGPITLLDCADLRVQIAAEASGFEAERAVGARMAQRVDRCAALAVVAARQAGAHAGLDIASRPDRVGVVIGSGLGGVATYERGVTTLLTRGPSRVSPYLTPAMIANAAAAQVAMDLGARGPSLCPTTACAAGTDAIGLATDMIRLGRADAVIAGGAEAPITRAVLAGFASMRAASLRGGDPARACRPFAADRDGLVIGEGAAVLVVEERESALARGAVVLAEVVGYGASSDAHHITAPDPRGAGAAAAIQRALNDAGIEPSAVGYVNAHGTGTVANDAAEALALHSIFGASVPPISSTKSMTGHLMGAAGALEALIATLVLRDGMLPPTINCEHPDTELALDVVPGRARPAQVEVVLSNSFGFGGHNACLLLRRPQA